MSSLKYYPRLNLYKNYNGSLSYDPVRQVAYSYKWYELFKVIDGIPVLNTYRYSNTTAKHVRVFRGFTNKEFVEIEAPMGLQDLNSAISLLEFRNEELNKQIQKKGSKFTKNEERIKEILMNNRKIELITKLLNTEELKNKGVAQ